ncbi:hypothetical protein [Niabella aurantiaca]|uniref:hypothetical protein n=1 Tax=Niabella aurantiaca TaxID=379900 RepID=UPI00036DA5A5|nr:hypothetical protein [Niabella aurantiaca]
MKISIPTPCHENWETMKPGENGRYCGSCCKTVVDFTGMAPEAISDYLVQHRSEHICGRLTEKQLAMEYDTDIQIVITHIARSGWPLVKKIAAAFILLLALSQNGNAQVTKDTLQQIVVTGGIKQKVETAPKADPFAAPISSPNTAQCLEGRLGGVVITPQKKTTKRKLKKIQKRRQKNEQAATPLTGEVIVVAGMVQKN